MSIAITVELPETVAEKLGKTKFIAHRFGVHRARRLPLRASDRLSGNGDVGLGNKAGIRRFSKSAPH